MQSKMARTEGGQRERERKEAIKTMVELAVQVIYFQRFSTIIYLLLYCRNIACFRQFNITTSIF